MYKIIWTSTAKNSLKTTLEYWSERNKSNSYPRKILNEIILKEDLLKKNPLAGEKTDYKNIRRILILRNFSLFYQDDSESKTVKIISFRDNRQKPKKFN